MVWTRCGGEVALCGVKVLCEIFKDSPDCRLVVASLEGLARSMFTCHTALTISQPPTMVNRSASIFRRLFAGAILTTWPSTGSLYSGTLFKQCLYESNHKRFQLETFFLPTALIGLWFSIGILLRRPESYQKNFRS